MLFLSMGTPPKFNIHITLPRMSYERLIYARSIGYFASEDYPAGIYLLKVNNRNSRTRCEICSKLTIKWRRPSVFIVNFEHISHLVLVFPLLTLNM